MKKIFLVIFSVGLLAVSCDPFAGGTVSSGILKTANGGVDWQTANIIKGTDGQLLTASISKLKFAPSGDTIFASAYDGGLYKTDDAAESWEEVLGQISLFDFSFASDNQDVIYAAGHLSDRGKIFKTLDGGKSWKDVYTDAGEKNPVRSVAVNPDNNEMLVAGMAKGSVIMSEDGGSSWRLLENYNARVNQVLWQNGVIYVLVKQRGIYVSEDSGSSFRSITNELEPKRDSIGFTIFGSRVNDYRQMSVDPYGSDIYVTTNNGLYKSSNGGGSWTYVSMPYRQKDAAPHAVAVSDSVVYVSSGSIVFRSNDSGFSWAIGDTLTNGLVTTLLISRNLPAIAFAGVSK